MTSFEIYVFFLCIIVFIMLTSLFSFMLTVIIKNQLKLIRNGLEDKAIKIEYSKDFKTSKTWKWIECVFSFLLCLVLGAVFFVSVYMNVTEDRPANGIPSIKVVKSESMATKNSKNTYLKENHLNNQLQMFDLVFCRHLPKEEDLKLYDIVVYKQDDRYVIHRIVGIEEPNNTHPNERHFLLQGDAVDRADTFPVLYSQMRGIYQGERIPFVGSFVLFMQSPAGWLCILLVLFGTIAIPIVEKKVDLAKKERLSYINSLKSNYAFEKELEAVE